LILQSVLEFGTILGIVRSAQWVKFSKVYFTILRPKVWKIKKKLVDFVAGNSSLKLWQFLEPIKIVKDLI